MASQTSALDLDAAEAIIETIPGAECQHSSTEWDGDPSLKVTYNGRVTELYMEASPHKWMGIGLSGETMGYHRVEDGAPVFGRVEGPDDIIRLIVSDPVARPRGQATLGDG